MHLFGFDYGTSGGSQPITGLTGGAVFPQEIVPGPVILANNGAADCCQTDLGRIVTENNWAFVLASLTCQMGGVYHIWTVQTAFGELETTQKCKRLSSKALLIAYKLLCLVLKDKPHLSGGPR